jgi:undecaprenyl-diphosphatase
MGKWLAEFREHTDIAALAVVMLALLAVLGFIIIADEVKEGDTQRFDDWAIKALRTPDNPARPIGPVWLEELGRDMTALGGVLVLTLVTVIVVGYLWLNRQKRAFVFVLGATIGALILAQGQSLYRISQELPPQASPAATRCFQQRYI